MGKRPEDKIQEKLVELELSIKEEEHKHDLPAHAHVDAEVPSAALAVDAASADELKTSIDLYTIGGWGLLAAGFLFILSRLQVMPAWNIFSTNPMFGLLILPLFAGIGMLFYNYKSRLAQGLTVGTFLTIVLLVLSRTTFMFPVMTMLDFVIMGAPICLGAALLAKAQHKRRQLGQSQR